MYLIFNFFKIMSEVYAIRDEEGNLVNALTWDLLNQDKNNTNYWEWRLKLTASEMNEKVLAWLNK